jgi:hypothetical protein
MSTRGLSASARRSSTPSGGDAAPSSDVVVVVDVALSRRPLRASSRVDSDAGMCNKGRMLHRPNPLVVGVFAFAACSADDVQSSVDLPETFEEACAMVPGCETSPYDLFGPRESAIRVDLRLAVGAQVEFGTMEMVDVLGAVGRPTENLGGTHVIVAEDAAGNWLEVHPVSFPTTMLYESPGEFLGGERALADGDASKAIFFAPNDVDHFVVYDEQATEVARAPLVVERSFRAVQASPACSHVALLQRADHDLVPARTLELQDVTDVLVDPGPLQRAAVQAAFNRMAPTLCHGVTKIGFVEMPNAILGGYVVPAVSGDLILINDLVYSELNLAVEPDRRIELIGTITHEAAHATEALLQHQGQPAYDLITFLLGQVPPQGGWTFEAEAVGSEHVQKARLLKGFTNEWQRMHRAFISEGFGEIDYVRAPTEPGQCAGPIKYFDAQQTAESGFMSRYGGTNRADDIAEMVAWSMTAPLFRSEGVTSPFEASESEACGGRSATIDIPEDSACRTFRTYDGDGIPLAYAAAYTKLRMVYELGMITENAFDECVGNVGFRVPGPGFHVYEDGVFRRSFDQGVTAIIGEEPGASSRKFVMNAEGRAGFGGEEYDAAITLELVVGPADVDIGQTSWPRGGYRLTSVDSDSFRLHLPEAPAGSFEVTKGFVLVTASSNDRIEGSVIVQEVWRWLAPIPVPEVYDPPLVFRFLIEN